MAQKADSKTTPTPGSFSHLSLAFDRKLQECSLWLQAECVRRTGSITVPYIRVKRRPFPGPEMVPADGPIDLKILPQFLYGQTTYSPGELLSGWEQIATMIFDRQPATRLRRFIRAAFPALPFIETADGRHEAVQYLCAASWSVGQLKVGRDEVLLTTHDSEIGFKGTWVLQGGGQKRRPRVQTRVSCKVLQSHLGTARMASAALSALHEFLLQQLPDLEQPINTIFNAAVMAGVDQQKKLTAMFDLVFVEDTHDIYRLVPGVWGRARAIAENPVGNPLPDLARLLIPKLGARTFMRLFGNPYRGARTVTEVTRKRLRAVIDRLHHQSIVSAGGEIPGTQSKALRSVMELQQMIGRVQA